MTDILLRNSADSICLPQGWTDTGVGKLEMGESVEILQPGSVGCRSSFVANSGSLIDVRAGWPVIKFAVDGHSGLGPDVLQNKLSPQPGWAMMTSG